MNKNLIPLFKWSGGKRRELEHVSKHLPESFERYCEPFVGGGAVWFALNHGENIIGDANDEVINFYKIVKEHKGAFIDDLNSWSRFYMAGIAALKPIMDANKVKPNTMDKKIWKKQKREEFKLLGDIYYFWRDGRHTTEYDLAKRFYVLRNLAFGGMLRYSRDGKFNIPYGYYKNFKTLKWNENYDNIFDNTTFFSGDWQDTVEGLSSDDFVFLDPPYTRAFTKYSPTGDFTKEDHRELAEWFRSKKAKAMIILNKDEFTTRLYGDFIKEEYPFSYGIRYKKKKEKDILFTVPWHYDADTRERYGEYVSELELEPKEAYEAEHFVATNY